jgi:hypothetical protein
MPAKKKTANKTAKPKTAKKTPSSSPVQAKRELANAQANAGIGLLAQIETIDDELIKNVLLDALSAVKTTFVRDQDPYEEPDWNTRLKAVQIAADRKIGLPIRREEHLHRNVTTEEEWMIMLKESPELRSHLRKMIDDAEDVTDI